MKGLLTGLSKLILGVTLSFVLLSFMGVATARYFMAKLSVLPPKPTFDNDAVRRPREAPAASPQQATPPANGPTATPVVDTAVEEEKPPGSYEAIVVQPIGLILRAGAGLEYQQIGGVDYNEDVLVLKTSGDGRWLNVRVNSGQVGWVKAGNTRSLSE